jgi:hypothetical protein
LRTGRFNRSFIFYGFVELLAMSYALICFLVRSDICAPRDIFGPLSNFPSVWSSNNLANVWATTKLKEVLDLPTKRSITRLPVGGYQFLDGIAHEALFATDPECWKFALP